MKLEAPQSLNYCATVVRVKNLIKAENSDNLQIIPMFGLQAIVDMQTKVGDVGILFPAECQLSDEYTKANSLYRHAEKNIEPDKKGYLEDNRRVRAIKLRGNRSDALFMPVSSIEFAMGHHIPQTGDPDGWMQLKEGDQFDRLNGVEICRKFVRPIRSGMYGAAKQTKKQRRVEEKFFPQHFDSANFFRVEDMLDPNADCVVSQKLHGTSIRVGNVPVARKFSWLERLVRKLGVKVQETEFSMVYGSRKVIKDANDPDQAHYYDEDIWTREGSKLDGLIPENYIVYGELIGWVPGTDQPIQKHYTYDCLPGTCRLYIYRVSVVNGQGTVVDLSWPALKEFCTATGLNHVPEILTDHATVADVSKDLDQFLDKKFTEIMKPEFASRMVRLSDDSPCDEGVCIRIEGTIPNIVKAKSPMFLAHETSMLDADVTDVEAEQEPSVP